MIRLDRWSLGGVPAAASLLALGLAVLGGCSVLVDPRDEPRRCTLNADGSDPCPDGLRCVDGLCASMSVPADAGCVPSEDGELCNGDDDDCDGTVDEGQDADSDGVTWCGGGILDRRDCDDSDPTVRPAIPGSVQAGEEVCDGKDNDCDGTVDEAPEEGSLCPADQECIDRRCAFPEDCTLPDNRCQDGEQCDVNMNPPTCVPGGCEPGDCPDGEVCDEETRTCVQRQPLGSPCSTNGQCLTGNCVPTAALALGDGAPERICSTACCDDTDCDAGQLCWSSGTGARLCVPEGLVGRERGEGGSAADCEIGSDCASGLCIGSLCLGNCSNGSQCSESAVCSFFGPYDRVDALDFYQLACRTPSGSGGIGSFCWFNSDCRSGACVSGLCSGACSTSADCGGAMYCGYLPARASTDDDRKWLQMCAPRTFGAGAGRTGETCAEDGDCLDRACVREQCADTCCSDSDCPDGTRCRPLVAGTRYEMHCIP